MNFYSDEEMRAEMQEFKKNIIKICAVVLMIMLVSNVVVLSAIKTDLAEKLTAQLIEDVTGNVESTVAGQVTENLTASVLSQYVREYKLRDEDVSVGTYVSNLNMDAVLDVICTGRKVSGGTVLSETEIRYSYTDISSTATAMVINEQGYVLTNAHVIAFDDVEGQVVNNFGRYGITWKSVTKVYTGIYVAFYGEDELYELQVLDYDLNIDLALLKFVTLPDRFSEEDFDGYTAFGDSDALELGEAAVIIGNAYDLGISVTTGTITNTSPDLSGYDIGEVYARGEIIQTDTAINGGNSGGPMFDSTAYCVGIATFKIASEATEGLGFAIASNLAVKYIASVSEKSGQTITVYTYYGTERYAQITA